MILDQLTYSAVILYAVVPVTIAVVGKLVGGIMSRLAALEAQQDNKLDKIEARQLIEDKVGPMKEDLIFIRDRIVSLTDRLLDGK